MILNIEYNLINYKYMEEETYNNFYKSPIANPISSEK